MAQIMLTHPLSFQTTLEINECPVLSSQLSPNYALMIFYMMLMCSVVWLHPSKHTDTCGTRGILGMPPSTLFQYFGSGVWKGSIRAAVLTVSHEKLVGVVILLALL